MFSVLRSILAELAPSLVKNEKMAAAGRKAAGHRSQPARGDRDTPSAKQEPVRFGRRQVAKSSKSGSR